METVKAHVCLNCAAPYPGKSQAEYGLPDWPWWLCSPCRAEATGTVDLTLPMMAAPTTLALGGGGPRAIHKNLAGWVAGLHVATAQVAELLVSLGGSDEEVTAHAVMGTDPLGDAPRLTRHPADVRTLVLTDLPVGTARRLAETTFAEGPHLSTERIRELAAELTP
jgi:hypothetical protein